MTSRFVLTSIYITYILNFMIYYIVWYIIIWKIHIYYFWIIDRNRISDFRGKQSLHLGCGYQDINRLIRDEEIASSWFRSFCLPRFTACSYFCVHVFAVSSSWINEEIAKKYKQNHEQTGSKSQSKKGGIWSDEREREWEWNSNRKIKKFVLVNWWLIITSSNNIF